ncbi:uncharacterized protein EDB91DRAFT_1085220 [Suillus paluster]|uniref:uncharacterized protein n=1 Tax=Suillus paluster TaxID=48578 RepID=UPI001B88032D|nr:uncharacterized protein EDB91DRAFT_1085220 [Suillus paluster]KAG1731108.1 hypothetical protein EDB91DRAFT_1085220 [Suillus paluster]
MAHHPHLADAKDAVRTSTYSKVLLNYQSKGLPSGHTHRLVLWKVRRPVKHKLPSRKDLPTGFGGPKNMSSELKISCNTKITHPRASQTLGFLLADKIHWSTEEVIMLGQAVVGHVLWGRMGLVVAELGIAVGLGTHTSWTRGVGNEEKSEREATSKRMANPRKYMDLIHNSDVQIMFSDMIPLSD